MRFLAQVAAVVRKDFLIEFRTREMLSTLPVFALITLVIFTFALNPVERDLRPAVAGILWVAFSFAGLLGLGQAFAAERANDALEGIAMSPADRSVLFFGKFVTVWVLMSAVEIVLTPVFLALLAYPFRGSPLLLGVVILVSTVGFAASGTFLAALASHLRGGEVLLPILLLPIVVPVVIGAVRMTEAVLVGDHASLGLWMKVVGVYDVLFLALPLLLFEFLLES